MSKQQQSLFEGVRMSMDDSVSLTAQSLNAYGPDYKHWAVAFSGGKDSSATVTLVTHLIETGQVQAPESLTILYCDTGMELLPLHYTAMRILDKVKDKGYQVKVIKPALDDRFFVYMFGKGPPPPAPHFRYCTGNLKVKPMMNALSELRQTTGEKFLMITGVRIGESAARDARIALSCSKDGSECGQGYFQQTTPASIADTLAPIAHWRVCHIWDWLMFYAPGDGYPTATIAEAYGGEEAEEINARTGCVACNVASRETSLDETIKLPQWSYLAPLKRLKPLYAELRSTRNRLMKDGTERYADGRLVNNKHRPGPLTMKARLWGLSQVLEIQDEINHAARTQGRPEISLIDPEEHARILELIEANTWPDKWTGEEITGMDMVDRVIAEGVIQPLVIR